MMKECSEMEFPDWLFMNSQKNYATFHSFSKHLFSTYQVLGTVIGAGETSLYETISCSEIGKSEGGDTYVRRWNKMV